MIYVTRPELPDFDEFAALMRGVWEGRQLTNGGPLHERLERELAEYLGVPYISLMANGTLPLMIALRALGIESGEVVTTPFSFVATSHALLWSGVKPVFADIDPRTCCLSPRAAEAAITERTRAILPVHVYGRPCDVDAFEQIGRRHGIPVIYDAAHAFGTRLRGRSLLELGDMATLSFHATKVYNTLEGGALVCRTAEMKERVDRLKNFGFEDETHIVGIGINAKMDEMRAAVGLLNLRRVDADIERRGALTALYRRLLAPIPGVRLLPELPGVEPNCSHFPVFVGAGRRDALYERLKEHGISARRYFYPLITDFDPYRTAAPLPEARAAAAQVLCLPLYPSLSEADVRRIAALLKE